MNATSAPTLDRAAWREAVADVAEKAVALLPGGKAKVASQSNGTTEYKATLPACNGRVDAAVKMVLAGDVVCNGTCACKDYPKAPSGWCKHRIAVGIQKRTEAWVQATVPSASDDHVHTSSDAPVETPARH
jgi:hypothetical protein